MLGSAAVRKASSSVISVRGRPLLSPAPTARQPVVSCTRAMRTITLQPEKLHPKAFAPFGQVVDAIDDGKAFDQEDAQLNLRRGTPRLYIMSLPAHGMAFDQITYHANVTQCLCGLAQKDWFLAVAAPSHAIDQYPKEEDLHAFQIPPGVFVKLHEGTWHAGPHFIGNEACNFANLELADTNTADHNTHWYKADDITFEIAHP